MSEERAEDTGQPHLKPPSVSYRYLPSLVSRKWPRQADPTTHFGWDLAKTFWYASTVPECPIDRELELSIFRFTSWRCDSISSKLRQLLARYVEIKRSYLLQGQPSSLNKSWGIWSFFGDRVLEFSCPLKRTKIRLRVTFWCTVVRWLFFIVCRTIPLHSHALCSAQCDNIHKT